MLHVSFIVLDFADTIPSLNITSSVNDFTSAQKLIFNWQKICTHSTTNYTILSSNCGNCPTTTTNTTVTCTDVPTDVHITLCTFTLQPMVCGLSGYVVQSINVTLNQMKNPDNIVPPVDYSSKSAIHPTGHITAIAFATLFALLWAVSTAIAVTLAILLCKSKSRAPTVVHHPEAERAANVQNTELREIDTSENIAYYRITRT